VTGGISPAAGTAADGAGAVDWVPTGIDQLEPAAWDALRDEGCTAVIAGPGAGKTEFLAQRAAFLLQTGLCRAPHRILAISYKRDSAANLSRRVADRVPEHAERCVSLTFDAFTKGLVDRFRSALPQPWALNGTYEIEFWSGRDQEDFVTSLALRESGKLQLDIFGLPGKTAFLASIVGGWTLPADPAVTPDATAGYAALAWWREHYLRPGAQYVDFVMLNRLAELLVRSRPQLRRALRITYPYVFVDEFQDTTSAQLSFLASAFASATVTAVGDRKQRIMGFAGALPDALRRYTASFGATEYELTWNFRSSDGLLLLQHVIASRLDPDVAPAVSKAASEDGHVPASLWTFGSADREADYIAAWIAQDIAGSGRRPADFALVARQKVADYEQRLAAALAGHGISLRNDDVAYGKMRLQDMLKHQVARLVLGVLRLAAEPGGLAVVWLEVTATLARIGGSIDDDAAARRLADDLSRFIRDLRAWLVEVPVGHADPAQVVGRAVGAVGADGLDLLAGYVRSAHPGDDITLILGSLTERLRHVMPGAQDWAQAFAAVEAADAVTLMTVHRSKGLEYHTVFFLGLDDDQWWAYQRDTDEATAAFFVGLSRAAQRLIFTSTNPAARSGKIADLYRMLDEAGVPETRVP
jgi:DNA helicase-2/ATP-dependent DNA helicase PcrA